MQFSPFLILENCSFFPRPPHQKLASTSIRKKTLPAHEMSIRFGARDRDSRPGSSLPHCASGGGPSSPREPLFHNESKDRSARFLSRRRREAFQVCLTPSVPSEWKMLLLITILITVKIKTKQPSGSWCLRVLMSRDPHRAVQGRSL